MLHAAGFLITQIALKQAHERGHFGSGPAPVIRRERVERQSPNAQLDGGFHDAAHCQRARAVTLDARDSPGRGPTPVAIHDDRDVNHLL